ncbi:hypothetical protein VOLCADRAFT_120852 [Volvox carteri f. nagariensis]|uniref:Electron transfer flavoprotein subunit alpha n=1 Tax=Volvox carteri f. nagariensis TaxID=3068 RepID=D8TVK6_VOLCA|nr:uncharacterized protein VOLCADRAFT_120852 [Volvox carteri f. nagariensis]EFJ48472.1 hypothetical protein VOLCADRAFT_120852 [Volvox carteri f. nagariensis]|eukprot:XP_002950271.1 hypothetical protein VOLCADRAFT_120852 [Volvox carteri f. nagariensis]
MLSAAIRQGQQRCTAGWHFIASSSRQASTLLFVEHNGEGKVAPATLAAASAASQFLPGPLEALVCGFGEALASTAASVAAVPGVTKVWLASDPSLERPVAEPLSKLLSRIAAKHQPSHLLAASTAQGRNLLPRTAALLGTQPVTDVVKILDENTFVRPIYAGNAFATVQFSTPPPAVRVVSVRPTAFAAGAAAAASSPPAGASPAPVEPVAPELLHELGDVVSARWEGQDVRSSGRPELGSAKVVVCGGRALKSAENFAMLEELADQLGGAVGASRAAVDAGFVPNDLQVGQTGKVVAPDLYIGVGISGAIQHLAGMKDSRTIVAINNDPEAPILSVADYGLVQDLFTAVPQLIKEVREIKEQAGSA